jgi:exonuclease SbcC
MIKSLDILNFQAHKESHFDFVPGVNVITGQSDAGKTSSMRSMQWAMTNRPTGDAFKNWDASPKDSIAVEITLDNGSVALTRENGKNTYLLTKNGEEQSFSAIKTDVPEEIKQLLNLPEGNIQTQHQSYFLLQDSPGEVARKLNELIGLDIIDTMFKNINSKIREASSEATRLKSDRDRIENELENFVNLAAIEKLITSIEKNEAIASGIVSTLYDLKKSAATLTAIKNERQRLSKILVLEPLVNKINVKIEQVLDLKNKQINLISFLVTLRDIKSMREEDKAWIELEPYYNVMQAKIQTLKETKERKGQISSAYLVLTNIRKSKQMETNRMEAFQTSYTDLLLEAKICPTCGTKMDSKKIISIMKEL